jgi:hypothetical protein
VIRIFRSWIQAPGFVEVMAKSLFASAILFAAVITLRAAS